MEWSDIFTKYYLVVPHNKKGKKVQKLRSSHIIIGEYSEK